MHCLQREAPRSVADEGNDQGEEVSEEIEVAEENEERKEVDEAFGEYDEVGDD